MALEGHGEPPEEWIVSRICDEFGCLPSVAIREMEETPAGLLWTILDMRAYARAKADIDRAKEDDSAEIEYSEMHDLVEEMGAEADAVIARELLKDRREVAGDGD